MTIQVGTIVQVTNRRINGKLHNGDTTVVTAISQNWQGDKTLYTLAGDNAGYGYTADAIKALPIRF